MPTTPNFEAVYGAILAVGTSPASDAVLTTTAGRPWASMRGTNACTP